jgi:hypothetical protein
VGGSVGEGESLLSESGWVGVRGMPCVGRDDLCGDEGVVGTRCAGGDGDDVNGICI